MPLYSFFLKYITLVCVTNRIWQKWHYITSEIIIKDLSLSLIYTHPPFISYQVICHIVSSPMERPQDLRHPGTSHLSDLGNKSSSSIMRSDDRGPSQHLNCNLKETLSQERLQPSCSWIYNPLKLWDNTFVVLSHSISEQFVMQQQITDTLV